MSNLARMQEWSKAGLVRYVDYALVKWLQEEVPELEEDVLLALLITSYSASLGQVCIDLALLQQEPTRFLAQNEVEDPVLEALQKELSDWLVSLDLSQWLMQLRSTEVIACGDSVDIAQSNSPFVLLEQNGRSLLYLRRYWLAEQTIVKGIQTRLARASTLSDEDIRALLTILFGENTGHEPTNWQRVACGIAASNHFSIITGGPGTGKTTTVLRLLALLQGQRLTNGLAPLAIRLAAPTGKAAARLNESIAANLQKLDIPAIGQVTPQALKDVIPTQVVTLHRLLQPKPNSRQFMHNESNPLVADIVVVDEASMIDVEMMASLFEGIEADTRVILLGDKDQLASVEAGYVLGDLCQGASQGNYTQATLDWLASVCDEHLDKSYRNDQGTTLNQAVSMLRRSYRFIEGGDIHQLATLVNEELEGDLFPDKLPRMHEIFANSAKGSQIPILRHLHQEQYKNVPFNREMSDLLLDGYGQFLDVVASAPAVDAGEDVFHQWGAHVLETHKRFQLLVALRRGEWGLEGLNHKIEQLLLKHGKLNAITSLWYLGRPVMVTRNDYSVDLMNGDVGISLVFPINGQLKQRVVFSDGKGGVRWVLPSRLQSVETVFAMTVHKSQGSEFFHTAMILPGQSSPILTKELIYTGITRSVKHFTLISGDEAVLRDAMSRKVQRVSGLGLAIR